MKRFVVLGFVMMLAGCASPTMKMSDQQIASLSDDQLCHYKNGYREEPRLNQELARRGILAAQCDRFFRECLAQGNQPGTQPMAFCIDTLRENERLRYEPPYDRWDGFGYGDYRNRR